MADTITITLPDITLVSLTPNPVNTNAALKISVKALKSVKYFIRSGFTPEIFTQGRNKWQLKQ